VYVVFVPIAHDLVGNLSLVSVPVAGMQGAVDQRTQKNKRASEVNDFHDDLRRKARRVLAFTAGQSE